MLSSITFDLIVADQSPNLSFDIGKILLRFPGRVPGRRAHVQRIWPASTCGKKSRPSKGKRQMEPNDQDADAGNGRDRTRTASRPTVSIFFPEGFEAAFKGHLKAHQDILRRNVLPQRPMLRFIMKCAYRSTHEHVEEHRHHGER